MNSVIKNLVNGQCVKGIFYLLKAFDMVNHELLLVKMGITHDWFIASYIGNKHQFVVIPDANVDSYLLQKIWFFQGPDQKGLPQRGRFWVQILFLLFINNVPNSVNKTNVCLFADGTFLTLSGPCYESFEQNTFLE